MKTLRQIAEKIQQNEMSLYKLEHENDSLRMEASTLPKKDISDWVGYRFASSSGLTKEFAAFFRDMRKYLKTQLNEVFVYEVHRGHFEVSGFAQNKQTGKWAYFSMSDIRYFPDEWYKRVLVRTAKDNKDYTGGNNQDIALNCIAATLLNLTA